MLFKSLGKGDSINKKGCIKLTNCSMFYIGTCCRGSEHHLHSFDQAQPNGVVEVPSER